MEVLWNIAVICAFSIVYVASMKTKLAELIIKDMDKIEKAKSNGTICHLRQTMAWAECGRRVNCPSSCQGQEDCTFPYCTLEGTCSCRNAFCRKDEMCHFFRIACATNFTCKEGKCYCENVKNKSVTSAS
ncbi:uncharacterized protein LOC123541072 [Mercenaria mercenaria]|uniref:uncharacterized protein LOC123541072 n=1 Tax=Mercenaria mercenaria TaxID=6596 RepID=UPI001E1DCBB3|nr:uncharacterized protein LOC123541072 [Mercenaria mercenaria]